jgi:hypothetical protein
LKKFEHITLNDGSFSTVISNEEVNLMNSAPTFNNFPFYEFDELLNKDLGTMNQSMQSDPEDIWEKLNARCHKKYGYNNEIRQPTKDDLKWGTDILPIYSKWEKLKDFQCLIENWVTKINQYMKKNGALPSSPTSVPSSSSFSVPNKLSPSTKSVPLSFASFNKGKQVKDKVNEDIEIIEIDEKDENKINEDLESMEIDEENEDMQNEDIESRTEGIYFCLYRIIKYNY